MRQSATDGMAWMCGLDRLGPWPEKAVAVLLDLGLTETEIARYFRVDPSIVRQARGTGPAPDGIHGREDQGPAR